MPEAPGYNQGNTDKAAALLKQASYKGEPIRILTSTQYDYQYKTAQVIEANLTEAGFKIDLVVTDWATILQRRQNPDQWEAFVTGHGVVPEPSSITIFNPSYPGWWDTPDKHAAAGSVRHRERSGEACADCGASCRRSSTSTCRR